MRHNEFPTHRDPVDSSHGFELRDIVLSVIIRWVLFLFVFMAFSAVIAYGAYLVFIPRNTTLASDSPLRPQRIEPPKPQLQAYPKAEMRDFRADEDTKVNDYAWLDKSKGVARIPVSEALKLTAARGLQTQQTNSSSVGAAYDPGKSGRSWGQPQPVGTDTGYKPPVVYRKYPY